MLRVLIALTLFLFFFIPLNPSLLLAKEESLTNLDLNRGIEEYNSKDFGKALSSLLRAKEVSVESELSAYYLGLIYKELLIYDKAVLYLKEAAWNKPPVNEAFYPLAEIYFDLGRSFDALGQIKNAEESGVRPAYTAYLKGLILISIDKPHDAVNALDSAKLLDSGLSVAVEYQKNIAFNLMRMDESPGQ